MFDDDPKPWLEGLNPEQLRAVSSDARSLLVVAGAGTGKTKTLAARVARLIDDGVPPPRILLLTFTRRAAREMIRRAERMVAADMAGLWGGTFHAVGNRLIRNFASRSSTLGDFTIMDQADSGDLIGLIRSEMRLESTARRMPQKATLASIYSAAVNAAEPLEELVPSRFPWCEADIGSMSEIFRGYIARKRQHNLLDYDDLLLYWRALLDGPSGDTMRDMFDHVLVDEYQDTNALQADILLRMRASADRLMVVGDDAQSIYSFRSADVRNILHFPDQHPECQVVTLESNYRSVQPILDCSNAVIAQAKERHSKELRAVRSGTTRPSLLTCMDEAEQSDEVCRLVLEHLEAGIALRDQAVLFRAGHHSALLEIELSRRDIPFVKYGGLRFVEAAHVKDVVCMLRVLENPHDELAWFRTLQLLEGVGAATARRLMSELGVRVTGEPDPDDDPLGRFIAGGVKVPKAGAEEGTALGAAFADCQGADVATQIERLTEFYKGPLERLYDSPVARRRDLDELAGVAGNYPSRSSFLVDMATDPPVSTGDLAGPPLLDEDYLILSTIHSAKGAEWDIVHLIHAADGMIPSDMATGNEQEIEEELRLLYVALTRARDHLYVYFPLRYHHRRMGLDDRHSYAQLSRFFTAPVLESFERRWTTASRLPEPDTTGDATASVDAFLSSLWS
jgi:DNA helicase-2/ATP-dependent DNA helicase PcrA